MDEEVLQTGADETPSEPAKDDLEVVIAEASPDAPRLELGADLTPGEPKPQANQTPEQHKKSAQDRIKELTFQVREADRQRQEALHQRQEAIQWAQGVHGQYTNLQKTLVGSQKLAVAAATGQVTSELEAIKQKLQEANERADYKTAADLAIQASQIAARQQNLAGITVPDELPQLPQFQLEEPQQPQQSDADRQWLAKNKWFSHVAGIPQNEESKFALSVHSQLVDSGVLGQSVQNGSPEYYEIIDNALRAQFPQKFKQPNGAGTPRPQQPVVAGVTRVSANGGGTRSITLTPSQAAIARATLLTYAGGDEKKAYKLYAEQLLRDNTNG